MQSTTADGLKRLPTRIEPIAVSESDEFGIGLFGIGEFGIGLFGIGEFGIGVTGGPGSVMSPTVISPSRAICVSSSSPATSSPSTVVVATLKSVQAAGLPTAAHQASCVNGGIHFSLVAPKRNETNRAPRSSVFCSCSWPSFRLLNRVSAGVSR